MKIYKPIDLLEIKWYDHRRNTNIRKQIGVEEDILCTIKKDTTKMVCTCSWLTIAELKILSKQHPRYPSKDQEDVLANQSMEDE